MRELTEGEAGYLAGIIDGEGCLRGHGGQVVLQVTSTDRPLIDWLCCLEGSACDSGSSSQPAHYRPKWQWAVYRRDAVYEILIAVAPYLITKKHKAELALEFIKIARWAGPNDPVRTDAYEALRSMNRPPA